MGAIANIVLRYSKSYVSHRRLIFGFLCDSATAPALFYLYPFTGLYLLHPWSRLQ